MTEHEKKCMYKLFEERETKNRCFCERLFAIVGNLSGCEQELIDGISSIAFDIEDMADLDKKQKEVFMTVD